MEVPVKAEVMKQKSIPIANPDGRNFLVGVKGLN